MGRCQIMWSWGHSLWRAWVLRMLRSCGAEIELLEEQIVHPYTILTSSTPQQAILAF